MKNVVLIGFMGTGKTRVGQMVARRLGYKFVDTDDLIVRKTGMPISEIFAKFGEPHFRDIEQQIVAEVAAQDSQVIATGGGVPIREKNIRNLRRNGLLFCLNASPEVIEKRTSNDNSRPLLYTNNRLRQIEELLEARKPFYSAADYQIDTTNKTASRVAEEIIRLYRSHAKNQG